jgi:phosphatidylserine/phosphatidylglycerophosphate/cardiolipin synthase-like enzyme
VAAGVSVRVILDQNEEKTRNTAAYNALTAAKAGVHWANPAFAVTHQKTITVDRATSAIMTLNLAAKDYPTSRDFAVITGNAADVAAIVATFEADFTNTAIHPPAGENLVWSPANSRSALLGLIGGASKSLLISQEEFSDTGMANAVKAALKRGVSVRLVQENQNNKFTSILNQLKAAGAHIAVYTSTEPTSHYIHAKTVLADYGTERARLFLGSENFSATSLDKNRELGLIFDDENCMASVAATLSADFTHGAAF